jgi:hypothetical protein
MLLTAYSLCYYILALNQKGDLDSQESRGQLRAGFPSNPSGSLSFSSVRQRYIVLRQSTFVAGTKSVVVWQSTKSWALFVGETLIVSDRARRLTADVVPGTMEIAYEIAARGYIQFWPPYETFFWRKVVSDNCWDHHRNIHRNLRNDGGPKQHHSGNWVPALTRAVPRTSPKLVANVSLAERRQWANHQTSNARPQTRRLMPNGVAEYAFSTDASASWWQVSFLQPTFRASLFN